MVSNLNTSSVPLPDREFFWRQVMENRFMALNFEPLGGTPFAATLDYLRLGNLDLMRLEASAHAVARSTQSAQTDASEFFMISYQIAGEGKLEQANRFSTQTAGDFVLYDSRRPFNMSYSSDFCKHVIRIPRAKLLAHITNPESLCAITVQKDSEAGLLLGAMLRTLFMSSSSSSICVQESLAKGLIEVAIGGLQSIPDAAIAEPSKLHSFHLQRVKLYIAENLSDPSLNIEKISVDLKLSISSLYRVFEMENMTLSQWIWNQRLEHCKRDLLARNLAHKNIGDIAFDWGFSNFAHFSRAFKKETGMTPREFRLAAQIKTRS